jgi:hypothetical protein
MSACQRPEASDQNIESLLGNEAPEGHKKANVAVFA